MDAATNQSGSTRLRPLVVAVAASVAVAGVVGLGALAGKLPAQRAPIRSEEPLARVEPKPAQQSVCALCGTIESIRTVEVLEDAGPAGAAEPKGAAESGGASSQASMLDTLSNAFSGNDAARSARKRYAYRVTVRMDDGSFRAISLSSPPAFAVGDKVRVVEGRLVRS
jgi:outer membrane lipoprotein SlyB